MRITSTLAALLLCSTVSTAPAEGLLDMTDAERAAFNSAVADYLLANPEILVEAMEVLQEREEAQSVARDQAALVEHKDAIYANPNDWAGGNLEGDLTIVEFMDYRCGYCHKAYADVAELISSDGNIRFVLKEFPVLGEQSVMASKFAISVRRLYGDDAYKAAHDALFALRGEMTEASLARLGADLGHDANAIGAEMAKPEVQAILDENYALANALEINGTPSFVFGNVMVKGYVPLESMRQIAERERAKN